MPDLNIPHLGGDPDPSKMYKLTIVDGKKMYVPIEPVKNTYIIYKDDIVVGEYIGIEPALDKYNELGPKSKTPKHKVSIRSIRPNGETSKEMLIKYIG